VYLAYVIALPTKLRLAGPAEELTGLNADPESRKDLRAHQLPHKSRLLTKF
jgi:hypothetical protein